MDVLRKEIVRTFVLVGEFAGDTGTTKLEAELYTNWEMIHEQELPNFANTTYSLTIWKKKSFQDKLVKRWPLSCHECSKMPAPGQKFFRDRIVRKIVFCEFCIRNASKCREALLEIVKADHMVLPEFTRPGKFSYEGKKLFRPYSLVVGDAATMPKP